jgi:MSHA pilin protein MshD
MGVLILGFVLVPLLSQFYIGFQATRTADALSQATFLALDLMEEIKSKRFDEHMFPEAATPLSQFGPDSGEGGADRRLFDDVDDFHGWSSAPPRSLNGTPLPEFAGFTRSVQVEYVTLDASGTWQPAASGTFYKRVTVTVSSSQTGTVQMHTLFSYHAIT